MAGACGRLGNALFEIAATIGIAERLGESAIFPSNWIHRKFFSFPEEMFGTIPDDAVESTQYVHNMDVRSLPYLQDFSLFENVLPLMRDYLRPSPLAQEILNPHLDRLPIGPRLGVHVRRGDKIDDPGTPNIHEYFIQPGADYFIRGINAFPAQSLCVFSDDLDWCRANLPPADFYGLGKPHPREQVPEFWTQEPEDWIDLLLLASCDSFVTTGSTLGIWGALIADPPASDVLRPDVVYGPKLSFVDAELLFNPEWRVHRVA